MYLLFCIICVRWHGTSNVNPSFEEEEDLAAQGESADIDWTISVKIFPSAYEVEYILNRT